MVQRLGSKRTISDSCYHASDELCNLIGREPGLSFVYLQSLLISLINVCANIYAIWNRKFITAQRSTENTSCFNFFVYFFYDFVTPRVSTRGIASFNKFLLVPQVKLLFVEATEINYFNKSVHMYCCHETFQRGTSCWVVNPPPCVTVPGHPGHHLLTEFS